MRNILLLGASGSIGKQTLDIIQQNSNDFNLVAFSVGHNHMSINDILKNNLNVKHIYLMDKKYIKIYKTKYPHIKFYNGSNGLKKLVKESEYDLCVNALVGFVGLEPSYNVLKRNKILCLANKESLVVGGDLLNELLKKGNGKMYPIDSEHVGIAKCLAKVKSGDVKRIIITASGGALRDIPLDDLKYVTPAIALKHPNWSMGQKITIDCATMMNKGFEVIEAYYLFNYKIEQINTIIHKESLVHAIVELNDNTYIVDYGMPDMHGPIKYALYEGNIDYDTIHIERLSDLKDCHFKDVDYKRYPCLALATSLIKKGGSNLVVLNAANEVAVSMFLNNKISYLDIYNIVNKCISNNKNKHCTTIKQIKQINNRTCKLASRLGDKL